MTFDSNGGSEVDSQLLYPGDFVTKPNNPTKGNYVFEGWTLNGVDYDFSTPVSQSIELYANFSSGNVYIIWDKSQEIMVFYRDISSPSAGSSITINGVNYTVDYVWSNFENWSPSIVTWDNASIKSEMQANVKTILFVNQVTATTCYGLFSGFTALEEVIGIYKMDTSNVGEFSRMFKGCSSLKTLDLTGLNSNSITYGSNTGNYMFSGCSSLTYLNMGELTLSGSHNLNNLFEGCTSIETLIIPANFGYEATYGVDSSSLVTHAKPRFPPVKLMNSDSGKKYSANARGIPYVGTAVTYIAY